MTYIDGFVAAVPQENKQAAPGPHPSLRFRGPWNAETGPGGSEMWQALPPAVMANRAPPVAIPPAPPRFGWVYPSEAGGRDAQPRLIWLDPQAMRRYDGSM